MRSARMFGSSLFGASLLFIACGEQRESFETPFGFSPDASPPPPRDCEGTRCSRDLKKVLRGCDDEVVESCGPDKGCGDGTCVDACTSAALSRGSIGCSFWTIAPDDGIFGRGPCFAAMIANTWDRPITLSAELGAEPIDIGASTYTVAMSGSEPTYTPLTVPLPPGQVAIVFLSQGEPAISDQYFTYCPSGVVPAIKEDPFRHGTTITRAFHLRTDAPVTAYSIYPYGGARSHFPSATLLLPVSSWDKQYLAINAWPHTPGFESGASRPFIQVVANEDDTEVRMRANVEVLGNREVAGASKGQTQAWKLSRGQVLQITQVEETTGSPLEANKPVGLFGGTECGFIPAGEFACDINGQQIAPLSQWGSEYALVPYRPRLAPGDAATDGREKVPWRLVGAADGTILTYEPARPGTAPATLQAGQVAMFMTEQVLVVRSQDKEHPFYAASYMTGSMYESQFNGQLPGDPDFVNVVPSEQYLDRYVFFADYTFPETTITVVRKKTAKGFASVELECAGELSDFRPLGTSGIYEFTWLRLTESARPRTFAKGSCGYGRHEARSDGPFSLTVWGMGTAASYGYAGGQGSRPINDVGVIIK